MDYNAFFSRLAKNDTGGLFLFHGTEEYVKQSALKKLEEAIEPAARDLNIHVCKAASAAQIREAAETLPFFAARRLVVCHELQDAEAKLLLNEADALPDTTTLVLYYRGNCKKDVLKLAQVLKRDVFFDVLSETDAMRFLWQQARAQNVTVSQADCRLLVAMVGTDVHTLRNELQKAAQYAGAGNSITADVLHTVVTPTLEYEFFGMLNALLDGKRKTALRALRHMLRNDTGAAFMLAHSFARQCKQMLQARQLIDSGISEQALAAKMGVSPWSAKTALRGAKARSASQLQNAALDFASIDFLQVSGQMPAERSLELAIIRHFS